MSWTIFPCAALVFCGVCGIQRPGIPRHTNSAELEILNQDIKKRLWDYIG